ncbi:MAG TPA: hypothetical protein VHE81_17620 [Lacipirellulaceae bacterium]|nr:hypothetical protein [Lacipirellulaceae bacterium]HWB49056.1 hypothetical protein [Stellaceae bacterium]
MNRIVFASLFALYPLAAIAQSADEFEDAKWGATEQAVQAAFKGTLTHYSSGAINGKTYPHFGIPKYDMESCDLYVDFKFSNNRLVKVDLSLNHPDAADAADCPTKIAKMLTGKFGLPKTVEPFNPGFSQGQKRVWLAGNTKITQVDSFLSALNRTLLTLSYESASPDAGKF